MKPLFTREQRKQLFDHRAGGPPPITGEGVCPFEPGRSYPLSNKLTLRVLEVLRRRKGGWSLRYELIDRRDPPKLLKRTPRAQDFDAIRRGFDEHGFPTPLTPDAERQAAKESAYDSRPGSLSDAGEAVDDETQDRFSGGARTADHLRGQKRWQQFERRNTLERLAAAKAEAVARSIDISHHERVIADRVDRIERQLGKGKAA